MLKKFLLSLTAFLSTITGVVSVASAATHQLVSPTIMAKAQRVSICEEGGNWHVSGSIYAGGLGWRLATWTDWRASMFPLSAALASPQQQAWAMAHFVAYYYHGWWPDQTGCTGGY